MSTQEVQGSLLTQPPGTPSTLSERVVVVVFGASGDLAKKKTFPALCGLFHRGLLSPQTRIVGYSRTPMTKAEIQQRVRESVKGKRVEEFVNLVTYVSGKYDDPADYAALNTHLAGLDIGPESNRLFYLAVPPSVFEPCAVNISKHAQAPNGWTRVIVEKPFGSDLDSFVELNKKMIAAFKESQIYRIDHFLGKELVQNVVALRFGNQVWEPVWNCNHIDSVQIVFKEDIGTQGRGGYFDSFGIVRDIVQNHLLQVFALIAMECPANSSADALRDAKVRVLSETQTASTNPKDVVLGQYGSAGTNQGYLDDPTVPKDSWTATFVTLVLHVNNPRWAGVPFIFRAGKGLNEKKTEVRIQFKQACGAHLFSNLKRNELVMRIQPKEAIFQKIMTKVPGLTPLLHQTELDLSYATRFGQLDLPDAYERLVYACLLGNQSEFVRADELYEAWRIFTPLLHAIDQKKMPPPEIYPFGIRNLDSSTALIARFGYIRDDQYVWAQGERARQ